MSEGDSPKTGSGVPYTRTGGPVLEALIDAQLAAIVADLKASLPVLELDALVLGGGYGRGEGGARVISGEWRPYNDYDLVLVHRVRDEALLKSTLRRMHVEHSRRTGIHVDITPIRREHLGNLPPALTWYEFQKGHRLLFGEETVLSGMGERRLVDVPKSEWGRLLFNRGSGVLFSIWLLKGEKCRIAEGESLEAFTTRQVQKAWLALGDVWLADRAAYSPSVVERQRAWISRGSAVPGWNARYLAATEFKLTPTAPMQLADLTQQVAELAALYGEELSKRRAAESRPLVGLYSTVRRVKWTRWLRSLPWRYPRERLRIALSSELLGDPSVRLRLVGDTSDYIQLWEQYA